MRKLVLSIATILVLSQAGMAHPPKDIAITVEGERIKAVIIHDVKDPLTHYIDKVTVWFNGKRMIQQTYFRQEDVNNQFAEYFFTGLKKEIS